MAIQMYDGIRLRRLTRCVGFAGYTQFKVYRFVQNETGRYKAEYEQLAHPLHSWASDQDWEEIKPPAVKNEEPTAILIVVSQDEGKTNYGVFFEEKKAITYLSEKDVYDVHRFFENGETEKLTLQVSNGKLYLATEFEIEQDKGGE